MDIKPVIMAGGNGHRLWPMSKSAYPKQFLKMFSGKTMLQLTLERNSFLGVKPAVIVGEKHHAIAEEQIKELGIEADIIIEPVSKNTAPCAIIAALLAEKESKKAVLLLPADHYIENQDKYISSIIKGLKCASSGNIITVGLQPIIPHIGYGYIKAGKYLGGHQYAVEKFIEKPSLIEAKDYLASGSYYWNSGMFIFSPCTMTEIAKFREPSMYKLVRNSLHNMEYIDNCMRLGTRPYNMIKGESIDYAFMQKLKNIIMIRADFTWKDMGCWNSIFDLCSKDKEGNVLRGDVEIYDTSDSYIHSEGRITAAIGIKDLIIVNTPEASLVIHQSKAQDIKKIMERLLLKKEKRRSNSSIVTSSICSS